MGENSRQMRFPLLDGGSHFRQIAIAIIYLLHVRLRGNVVDQALCNVRSNAQASKVGTERAPQIMNGPTGDTREFIEGGFAF